MPRQRLPTPTSSSSSLLLSDEEEEKSSPDDEPSYSGSYLYCGCEYCPFYGHHVTPEMQRQIDENNKMPPSLIVDEDEDDDVEYLVEDIVIGPTYDPVGEAINVEVWGGRPWNQQHRNRF